MATVIQILPSTRWVDITSDVKAESGLRTSRGRQRLTDSTSSSLSVVLKNPAGRYSSDRPGTAYYRQLGRGTQIRVLEPLAVDTFARSVSNGWGSTETDPADRIPLTPLAWSNGAGSASDYSVTAGVGRHTLTTVTTARESRLALRLRPSVVTASVTVGALATGGSARAAIVARANTTGTCHYRAELEFTTSGAVNAAIARAGGPGDATLDTASSVGTYTAGSTWWIQCVTVGSQLYMKAWADGAAEPVGFVCDTEDVHLRKGQVALRSVRDSANSNGSLTFDWDQLTVAHPDFWGEIWSLVPMNTKSGVDPTVTLQASGILRRLSNTDKPIRSALYSSITAGLSPSFPPHAYWPLEDGNLATRLEAVGAQPGRFLNANMGADASLAGSAGAASVPTGGLLSGIIPTFPSTHDPTTDFWTANFLVKISEKPSAESVIARIPTTREAGYYEIAMTTAGDIVFRTPKLFQLILANFVFSVSAPYDLAAQTTAGVPSLFGRWVIFCVFNLPLGGSNYAVSVRWSDASSGYSSQLNGPSGTTVWQPPSGTWVLYGPPEQTRSFAHFTVHDGFFEISSDVASGYVGERARTRLSRLAAENGISPQTVGTEAELMGPQLLEPLVANWEDCASTDLGIMSEPRHTLGIEYKAHQHLYNQWPHAVIDVDAGQLTDGLAPVRDDQRGLANEVTATRDGGTPQTFTIPAGDVFHLTPEDPPAGVGLVQATMQPNVEVDRQAHQQAAWRTHHGASRAARYEGLTVKLHAPPYSTDPQLAADIRALAEGDVIRIVNVPSAIEQTLPPGPRELMVQGLDQFRDSVVDEVTFNTTPADDWRVWCMDANGSTIVAAADSTATSLKVATALGPPWRPSPDPGWSIQGMTGGEAMFVTGCTTDTPTFVASGSAANGNNSSISPGIPAGMADGGLMILFASIRNSGAGTVNVPTGWTSLVDFGNVRLMYRYWVSGDSAPTVTFSGGVANADTVARIFGWSGLSHVICTGSKTAPAAVTSLNSSAQNMAYGAFNLPTNRTGASFIFAWKQDDWTGVAPPSGFTELWDASATTGDDVGVAAYYDLTGQTEAAGSLVVTGGLSAISRTIAFHLRPLQTLTVERSVNGVVGSLVAGETIHVWNHGAVPL